MVNFTRALEIAGTSGFVQPIKLVQYDDTLPVGVFEFTENGQPFDIPAGAKAKVRMRKADGKGVYNDATVSGDTVQVVFTQQMTAAFGVGFLNIELIYDGGIKYSEPVQVMISENAVQENAIESSDEFLTLEEILAECQKYGKIVETNAGNIQAVADNLTAIKNAPTEAAKAEAAADRAEAAAKESVGFRTFNQNIRPDENGDLDPTRPMLVGSGASVEMKSTGDRIHSVTSYGFTEQSGSGDPSPTNVRKITVGGLQANLFSQKYNTTISGVSFTFDGTGKLIINGTASSGVSSLHSNFLSQAIDIPAGEYTFWCKNNKSYTDAGGCSFRVHRTETGVNELLGTAGFTTSGRGFSFKHAGGKIAFGMYIGAGSIFDNNTIEVVLNKGKTVAPYTPFTGEEYGTVVESKGASDINKLIPLTAPLCDGDTVETCVKSGCDKKIVLDGTETLSDISNRGTVTRAKINGKPLAPSGFTTVFCNKLNRLDSWTSDTAHCYVEVYPYIFIENSKLTSTDALGVQKHLASAYEAGEPYILWYRSTEYTAENDIPVCLEKHNSFYNAMTGNENLGGSGERVRISYSDTNIKPYTNFNCSHFKYNGVTSAGGAFVDSGNLWLTPSGGQFGTAVANMAGETYIEKWRAYAKQQYEQGTPVVFTNPYNTPLTYAHDPVYLEAYPDGNGKFTVSGEKTIDLYAKPFTDASTLDGKHADEFASAGHVHNYAGSSTPGGPADTAVKLQTARTLTIGKTGKAFDGSANTTWTLAELGILDFIYPIGSIFEWASVSGSSGPSFTTVAAVQNHFGGTWEAYGTGRVTVGIDTAQTEFNTVGKTGGEKTHTLTESELPVISGQISSGFGAYGTSAGGYGGFRTASGCFSGVWESQYRLDGADKQQYSTRNSYQGVNLNIGGGNAHNNLQPYITVYRYRRIK